MLRNHQAHQEDVRARVAKVEAKHPGWTETREKPEFKTWLEGQPAFIQRTAMETEDPDELIGVFDMFVASQPKPPDEPAGRACRPNGKAA